MLHKLKYLLLVFSCLLATSAAFGQIINGTGTYPNQQGAYGQGALLPNPNDTSRRKAARQLTGDELMDTLRAREEKKKDSVILNSKFIRVTNELLLTDSTQVFPLDTGLTNFENYSPLYQPKSPKIGLGSLGLPERDLLFEPRQTVGFDVGLHYLDAYMFTPQDVQYYKARVPYTNMYLVTAGRKEQIFKVIHTQNINPQLNIGANFNLIGSQGFYNRQGVSDLNAALFSWYESKSKRYNLLTSMVFNNLRTPESGAIRNDSVFTAGSFDKITEPVRLTNAIDRIRNNTFYLKQFYFIGRIDTTATGGKILPTQRVTHTFYYNKQSYIFTSSGPDTYKVFPDYFYNNTLSRDSLGLTDIHNDFSYSFYLRGRSVGFVKNEVKLDLGIAHDLYHYSQWVSDSLATSVGQISRNDSIAGRTFQNITLKAKFSYRFSDRLLLEGNFQQVAQGYNGGDYLYDAKLHIAGGRRAGRIILEGYAQNNTPSLVFTNWVSNHYVFKYKFDNQKITSASFNYINDALALDLKAQYYLISDYLYFKAQTGGIDATPTQLTAPINLLKVSLSKSFSWRRWHMDNYVVYQKTDYQSTLRTPEVYLYSNIYYNKYLFDAINLTVGANVRYNSTYVAPSYAPSIGQFYNGADVTFTSYPYIVAYVKATLKSTNIFVMYDYANQGIFSPGFYTVNRYPMQDRLLKIGVSWAFYN